MKKARIRRRDAGARSTCGPRLRGAGKFCSQQVFGWRRAIAAGTCRALLGQTTTNAGNRPSFVPIVSEGHFPGGKTVQRATSCRRWGSRSDLPVGGGAGLVWHGMMLAQLTAVLARGARVGLPIMINIPAGRAAVLLATRPIDFSQRRNTLSPPWRRRCWSRIRSPGAVIVYRAKAQRTRLKILVWDTQRSGAGMEGNCSRDRSGWPPIMDGVMRLSAGSSSAALFDGLDLGRVFRTIKGDSQTACSPRRISFAWMDSRRDGHAEPAGKAFKHWRALVADGQLPNAMRQLGRARCGGYGNGTSLLAQNDRLRHLLLQLQAHAFSAPAPERLTDGPAATGLGSPRAGHRQRRTRRQKKRDPELRRGQCRPSGVPAEAALAGAPAAESR